MRNEELASVLTDVYTTLREAWVRAVEAYQDAGMMPADIPADHVARTMIATVQGFIAQQALFGPASVEVLQDGLRALTGMRAARPGP